ncbi:hypothetical protein CRYUN_Cryun05aG0082000 [Craigia yunnanensis]
MDIIAHNISVEKVDQLISNINACNIIAFNDNEIPLKGLENTKALYIIISCKGHILPRALKDNGS